MFNLRFQIFCLLAASPVLALAEAVVCNEVINNSARLLCYDELYGKPMIVEEKVEVVTPEPEVTDESLVRQRMGREDLLFGHTLAILPHRQTYILPYTYLSEPNQKPFAGIPLSETEDQQLDNDEVKFQISFKVPLIDDFLVDDSQLWFGYTQLALWQMYNSDVSAPFRETNYEPEIFWKIPTEQSLLGVNLESVSIGFAHQSNGRGESLSRSWNRIYADFILAHNRWAFSVKPWYRVPESESKDDNPDIEAYLGYADFTAAYKWDDYTLSTMLRNNLRSNDNHTSVNMSLSFPLPGRLNGYIEYVNGYGESLIDYNYRNQRIGIGFILNNWY